MNHRIDTHHHAVPDGYRTRLQALRTSGSGSDGLPMPTWSAATSLEAMTSTGAQTAILSVSTPGTTWETTPGDAVALARDLNAELADLVATSPDRFGFFATVPMPHVDESVDVATAALDDLHADGVVLLANSRGTYLGQPGQDALWEALDQRSAVVFIHPNELPGPHIDGIPAFATDFLLDTTRAAYLLVCNGIRERYPNIRFILSHGGGFLPYAPHRLAWTIALSTGRAPDAVLDDFASFYFDTALTASAAFPSLFAFARPGHVLFGSDFPFAPTEVSAETIRALDEYRAAHPDVDPGIDSANALALFPRLGGAVG